MELVGLLHTIYDTQKVSDKFQKRDVVLKTDFESQYPQHVLLQFTQDKCKSIDDFRVGDFVKIQFNVRGREWNSPQGLKYFNTLDAWNISLIPKRDGDNTNTTAATNNTTAAPAQQNNSNAGMQENTAAPVFNSSISDNDDLPF